MKELLDYIDYLEKQLHPPVAFTKVGVAYYKRITQLEKQIEILKQQNEDLKGKTEL